MTCLSVPDQLERSVSLGDQWTNTAARRGPSQVKSKAVRAKTAETTSAATEFSQHLAEQLGQGGKHSSLQSLGLCYAEFSRRAVLNTVKMANRLVALDLSFAFIGIPGAQVVAAALRIDGYATLTQLNMRCNRTKSMGAQAILEALSMNERLTSLDLSHNEIRSDALDAVVELLNCNNVLSRLDLSQNEMIGVEAEEELRCLRHAIVAHRGLLSLGQVNSTIVELDDPASFTTVWQRKMTEEGRVSLKWKMAVRTNASASGDAGGASQNSPLVWKLVVNRKCEVRGSIEDEAASARFRFEEQGPSFMLYSAVAYCDEGDTIFLKLGIDQDASDAKHLYKIFVKDIVFIPHHSKDRRHLLVSIPRSLLGSAIQWRMKTQRRMVSSTKDPEVDPVSFLWEGVVQRVYIHTAGAYRLLARVQFPTKFAPTKQETVHMLESRYWWKLQRSSCWDPHTNHVVLEGTYFDMHGAVQRGSDLSVTTPSDDVELRVVQFQLFHEPIEVESRPVLSRRTSLRAQSVSTLSQLQLEEEDEITASVEKDNASPTEGDTAPSSADMPPQSGQFDRILLRSWRGYPQTSKRRITYAADEISPHALDRLGVNPDILKKEKGMKKLGICDGDITRGEELRRYTGVSQMEPSSKVEFMFGFNDEQLHRERAIKRLGTTEQEIMDDYSRRVSRLGVSNPFPVKL
ncbi:Leucine-rich repeat domain, L domain-like [Phytophthora cactorum]|nr:Leucine-rich repeat domain, L domain-like [Phytophthora cactorum]